MQRTSAMELLETRRLMAAVPPGSVKLTGNVIGTAGSYKNLGNTIANTFDNNTGTYFDSPSSTGWAGLDLGGPKRITQVQFVPRSGYAGRMTGGVFQGSTTADFATPTALFTVSSTPATGVFTAAAVTMTGLFQYVRYLAPANSYGNVAELEFDGIAVTPTAPPSTPVVTTTAGPAGVHLAWPADPVTTVDTYVVQRQGPADAGFVSIGSAVGTATSFDDPTALSNTAYNYQLIATNILGSATSTPVAVTTPVYTWTDADFGSPAKPGGAVVNPNGSITVTGGGADVWNNTDQFNFQYQGFAGNGAITARVVSQTNSNAWAKSGVMFRESTNTDSRFVFLSMTPSNQVLMQARTATHTTPTFSKSVAAKYGVYLQLVRTGGTFTGYMSPDGVTWTVVGSVTIAMPNNVVGGLAVTAHDNTKSCATTFDTVTLAPTGSAASNWTLGATAPIARWEPQNFSYNGKLYVFGGLVDRSLNATARGDVYDPSTDSWSTITTIPTGPMCHAAVTVVGDTAIFAGGDVGSLAMGRSTSPTAVVATYNITTNSWGALPSLPAAGACGGLVCINNVLYYFGGTNATNSADVTTAWSLDLSNPSAAWTARTAMPNPRDHIGAAVINGIAYAVGGNHLYQQTTGNDAEVDAYNPVTDTWTKVASLPIPIGSLETATLVVNNKIVIVGGQTNGGYDGIYLNMIYAYDPAANKWTAAAALPEAIQSAAVTYFNGNLIVTGGTVDNQGGWAQNQTWSTPLAV